MNGNKMKIKGGSKMEEGKKVLKEGSHLLGIPGIFRAVTCLRNGKGQANPFTMLMFIIFLIFAVLVMFFLIGVIQSIRG